MTQGRVKLHRSSQENILYFAETFTKWQAWQDMLLLTNHKSGVIVVRWNIIDIKRGQLWYSEDWLAKRRTWSRNKVRRFLNYLETKQQIEQHKSKVKSIITIVNYNKYQWDDTTDDTTDGHQTIQQTDTNKNVKKEKKEKEATKKFAPPTVEELSIYIDSKWYSVDAETFHAFYESKGWVVGKAKMKSWKSCLVTREKRNKPKEPKNDQEHIELYQKIGAEKYKARFWASKTWKIQKELL